jgi:predicted RNase H-like HicB family nuclease
MKAVYPIVMSKGKKYIVVYIPDFKINTQGKDEADAMEMARDAIGLVGIDMEDENEPLPHPTALANVQKEKDSDIITLIDVDFAEYRRKNDMRTIKKNCTIPSWLNFEAEKAGVNFSAVLQTALKQELHLADRV